MNLMLKLAGLFLFAIWLPCCGKQEGIYRASLGSGYTTLPGSQPVVTNRPNTSPFPQPNPRHSEGPIEIEIPEQVEDHVRSFGGGANFLAAKNCLLADAPLNQSGARVHYFPRPCSEVRSGTHSNLRFTVLPPTVRNPVTGNKYVLVLENTRLKVGLVQGYAMNSVFHTMRGEGGYQLVELCSDNYPCTPKFNAHAVESIEQN